jgi:hypothetical protein
MKKTVFTLLLCMSLTSCLNLRTENPWAEAERTLTVQPLYPDTFPQEALSDGILRVSSRTRDLSFTCTADSDGLFTLTLPKDSYRAAYSCTYGEYIYNGTLDRIIIGEENASADLALSVSKAGNIVFKEIYCGGCTRYPEQGNYQYDSYVILHNNSSQTRYLDSLCFASVDPYRSISTNVWEEDKDFIPVVQAIWQIGGDGHTFPLEPGADAVIVIYGAINHAASYPQSVNLDRENYFVCYNASYFPNTKYHPAPGSNIRQDHILNVVIKTGIANAYTFAMQSPAAVIFKAPEGTTIQEFLEEDGVIIQKPGSTSDKIVKLPSSWVMDGVEVFEKNGNNRKRLPSAIDAGAVDFSGPYNGHTLFRNTDEQASAICGFEVLTDTNNSTSDFYERETQSLHE